jgi:hypothetical protein
MCYKVFTSNQVILITEFTSEALRIKRTYTSCSRSLLISLEGARDENEWLDDINFKLIKTITPYMLEGAKTNKYICDKRNETCSRKTDVAKQRLG